MQWFFVGLVGVFVFLLLPGDGVVRLLGAVAVTAALTAFATLSNRRARRRPPRR